MVGEKSELHPVYVNKNAMEHDKQFTGTIKPLTWEESASSSRTPYSRPLNCSTCKPAETQTHKILPIARSYYTHSTLCNKPGYSISCVSLPHCSRLDGLLEKSPQTLLTMRLDDAKKDPVTSSRPLPLDGSVECSHITENPRNTRKAFELMSVAIQERRNPQTRLLESLEKVTFSKPSAPRDSIGQLPHHLNILPLPHESMTNANIGCVLEGNTQPKPLSQASTTLQKSRGLSTIRDIYTEEEALAFFDLTRSNTTTPLLPSNESSVNILKNSTSRKLFNEDNLSVINTASAVSFRRDGAKRRPTNMCVAVRPVSKRKFYTDVINSPNVRKIDNEQ